VTTATRSWTPLRIAASIMPVAEAAAVKTGRAVPNISWSEGWIALRSASISGPRWKNMVRAVAA